MIRWRVGKHWYAAAICLPPLVILMALALFIVSGHPAGSVSALVPGYLLPLAFVFAMITGGPLAEEPGWRGFALPIMLGSFRPLAASILLGIIWSLWHLPLFFITWSSQYGLNPGYYLIMNIGLTTLITWAFLHTEGSILIAMIFQTSFNGAATLLPVSLAATGSNLPLLLVAGIMCAAAGVVVVMRRQEFFSVRKERFV